MIISSVSDSIERSQGSDYINRQADMRLNLKMSSVLLVLLITIPANSIDTASDSSDKRIAHSLSLIENGDLRGGLISLNSIVLNGEFKDEGLDSVAKICSRIFLPQDIVSSSISDTIFFSENRGVSQPFSVKSEESVPASEYFRILADFGSEELKALPVIQFTFKFLLKNRFPFTFPFLKEVYLPQLKIYLRDDLEKDVLTDVLWFPGMPDYNADISIVVSFISGEESLEEYMYNIVKDRFDSVRKRDDLEELGAVSVRCYNHSAFRNVAGQFYAYIAFDRLVTPGIDSTMPVSDLVKKSVLARYLIAAKSSKAVEFETEYLVSKVLKLFSSVYF
ncbi:MAG: hypothetical protein GXY77_12225 [Fibrobacter sp.]|nr:hypothetical protein [Fibrobacter sp.]